MIDLRELLKAQSVGKIELDLEDDDIVTDVLVLVRIQKLSDTDDQLVIGVTENTGGIVAHGMLTCGVIQSEQWMTSGGDDER